MDRILKDISTSDIGTALLDVAMPRLCVVCRSHLLLRERYICTRCLIDLPLTWFWNRQHNPMADRFNEHIRDSIEAGLCEYEPYAFAAALFFYNSESHYKRIPQHLKYQAGIASGAFFATMLGRKLAGVEHFRDVDLVIPVPLHWTRRWKRGYNQAEVIASALAQVLGVSMRNDILRRAKRTRTQIRIGTSEKGANVRGAFCLSKAKRPAVHHILLVDDTFTTGATLNECRLALRAAFPPSVRISAVTLAFVSES